MEWFKKNWKTAILTILVVLAGIQYYLIDDLQKTQDYICERRDETAALLRKKLANYIRRDIRLENMQKTLQKMYQISEWEAKYYSILYDDFSQKNQIPWELYPATVRIESNFNPTLRSRAGACGLTQVMPETAKEVCKKLGLRYDPKVTLWNDLLCQVIGFTYLSESVRKESDSNYTLGSDAIKHGIKVYLGGPDYKQNIKKNGATGQYVREYKSSVWIEYERLRFVYKGVCSDNKKNAEEIVKWIY